MFLVSHLKDKNKKKDRHLLFLLNYATIINLDNIVMTVV